MAGIFTVSLDFELHWGGFEKWPLSVGSSQSRVIGNRQLRTYNRYFINARDVVPRMLELFVKYEIHVTWAAVGMLLHDKEESLLRHAPVLKPTYDFPKLSAYNYMAEIGIGHSEDDDPFHYARSLIMLILKTPGQELGSHTFSHFYCNEPGQTLEQFRNDLKAAQRTALQLGISHRSLVLPRNQFNDKYLKVCFEEGFTCVRSNPVDWFWEIKSTENESSWKRLNRGLDAYFPVGKKNTYRIDSITCNEGYPVLLPASRLLRPYRTQELFLNNLKLQRIHNEMQQAASDGEVYHLWWHPHNFGHYSNENLHALESILRIFKKMHEKHNMESLNMGEVSDRVIRRSKY